MAKESRTALGTTRDAQLTALVSITKHKTVVTNLIDSNLNLTTDFGATTGVIVQTDANHTFAKRTITGTAGEITVTNGSGVSGNPTLSLPTALTFTGKTITGGTYSGITLSGQTNLSAATEKTISGGVVTLDQNTHKLQPETGTADNLDTISGLAEGEWAILYASDNGTDTITVKHGTGNISCIGGSDISLSHGGVFVFSNGTTVFAIGGGGAGGGMSIGGSITGSPANNAFLYADSSDTLQAASSVLFDQTTAIFQLDSTTKGLLIPRQTGAQYRAISTPATGLQVFDTDFGMPRWFNGDNWYAALPMFGFAHRLHALLPNRSSSFSAIGNSPSVFSGAGAGLTEAYGAYTVMTTAASTNADGGYLDGVNSFYRGSTFGENGFLILSGLVFPDASYDESGASTGSRWFDGLTDQSSSANFLGSDNPSGHRVGVARAHVNGGLTETNIWFTVKDGTTETRVDSGVSFSAQAAYRWWAYCAPQGGTIKMQVVKLSGGTATYSAVASITTNLPGGSTALRRACGIRTIDAVARNIGAATKVVYTGFSLN